MENRIEWERIPENGFFLAYFQDGVELNCYKAREDLMSQMELWKDRKLLEAHIFNEEMEWRLVTSRRAGDIKVVLSKSREEEKRQSLGKSFQTFEEEAAVVLRFQNVLKKVRLINYLEFDENDMLAVRGYRIAPGKEELNEKG